MDLMLMMLGIGVALWVLKDVLPPNSADDGPVKQVLMGLYVTAALLAGGWLNRRGRRRLRRSWREVFGVLLSCAWACTGLYILYLIYAADLGD